MLMLRQSKSQIDKPRNGIESERATKDHGLTRGLTALVLGTLKTAKQVNHTPARHQIHAKQNLSTRHLVAFLATMA